MISPHVTEFSDHFLLHTSALSCHSSHRQQHAIIDCGAGLSIITEQTVCELGLANRIVDDMSVKEVRFTTANGVSAGTRRTISVTLALAVSVPDRVDAWECASLEPAGYLPQLVRFYVIQPPHPIPPLIGFDSLRRMRCMVDAMSQRMRIRVDPLDCSKDRVMCLAMSSGGVPEIPLDVYETDVHGKRLYDNDRAGIARPHRVPSPRHHSVECHFGHASSSDTPFMACVMMPDRYEGASICHGVHYGTAPSSLSMQEASISAASVRPTAPVSTTFAPSWPTAHALTSSGCPSPAFVVPPAAPGCWSNGAGMNGCTCVPCPSGCPNSLFQFGTLADSSARHHERLLQRTPMACLVCSRHNFSVDSACMRPMAGLSGPSVECSSAQPRPYGASAFEGCVYPRFNLCAEDVTAKGGSLASPNVPLLTAKGGSLAPLLSDCQNLRPGMDPRTVHATLAASPHVQATWPGMSRGSPTRGHTTTNDMLEFKHRL